MMNFFSAFSVKYQTQSFPQIVHRGGIPGLAEFPQGTWHRSCPQHWSLLENQESSQIHRVPTPNGLHFHCKRKQFWFLSVLPWAATPLGRSPGPGLQPMGMLASVAHRLPNITKAGAFVYQRVGSLGTAPLPRQHLEIFDGGGGRGCF